jgi:hypothetical protein
VIEWYENSQIGGFGFLSSVDFLGSKIGPVDLEETFCLLTLLVKGHRVGNPPYFLFYRNQHFKWKKLKRKKIFDKNLGCHYS